MNRLQSVAGLMIAVFAVTSWNAAAAEKKPWTERIHLNGDFRYRHEAISDEKAAGSEDVRVPDRVRHRFRLRLAVTAEVNSTTNVLARLASGEGAPNSTNQSLTDGFSDKGIWIDRAYLDLHPSAWISARAGKQGVPFEGTDLIWDSDVNLEGIALLPKISREAGEVGIRLGGFWAEENTPGGGQGMLGGQILMKKKSERWNALFAAAYYNWLHLQDGPLLFSAAKSYGNNVRMDGDAKLYLSDFDLVNGTAAVTIKPSRISATLSGDVVLNTSAKTNPATDEKDDLGWRAGIDLSLPDCPLDWAFGYSYRVLQADATVGVLADSDHGGGGTNLSGHGFSLSMKPTSAVKLGTNLLLDSKDPNHTKLSYRRLQVDLAASF